MSTEKTTDPGTKSAAELEREVEAQRAQVEDDLDQLQDRLSPGQMMDQLFDYVKTGNGAEFTRNLGRSMRDNPIPLALMGVGMAWLMMGGQSGRSRYDQLEGFDRDWDREWDDDRYERGWDHRWNRDRHGWDERFADDKDDIAGDPVALGMTPQARGGTAPADGDDKGMMAKAGDMAAKAGDAIGDMAGSLRGRAAAAGEEVGDAMRGTGEAASRYGRNLKHGARRYRDRFGRTVDRYGRRARQGFFDTLEEQPLVLGAIGVAVGAALGAALPATEHEDELMGETRDRLKRQAEEEGRRQAEKARDMADAAYGAAKDEADRQGLNAGTGQSVADDLKDKAANVADAAKTAAEREQAKKG